MGKMTPYEAWQIVSKMVDQTYTNQDYDDAVEIIREAIARLPNTDSTSATGVQEAIEELHSCINEANKSLDGLHVKHMVRIGTIKTIITALEQYRDPCESDSIERLKQENQKMKDRLLTSPYGDDKIDELEESLANVRFQLEYAQRHSARNAERR